MFVACGASSFRKNAAPRSNGQHAVVAMLEGRCIQRGALDGTEQQHPCVILRPMNASRPHEDGSQALAQRLSFVRRIKDYAVRGVGLHFVSWLCLILVSLAISIALLASIEGVRSAGAQQPDGMPRPSQTTSGVNSAQVLKYRNTSLDVRYVGSETCKTCHQPEYERYFQTPHGQAATLPTGRPELKNLPAEGKTVCPEVGDHCFRVFSGKDGYFMSQFDRAANGMESNVEVEKIAFALGEPLMATGYLIERGDYLFEAPLTFYAVPGPGHIQGWACPPVLPLTRAVSPVRSPTLVLPAMWAVPVRKTLLSIFTSHPRLKNCESAAKAATGQGRHMFGNVKNRSARITVQRIQVSTPPSSIPNTSLRSLPTIPACTAMNWGKRVFLSPAELFRIIAPEFHFSKLQPSSSQSFCLAGMSKNGPTKWLPVPAIV